MSRVVARGRIRVDARRALAKLREHLLVDLHDYLLEICRAAVASEAERIDVAYDPDESWIDWRGRPLSLEQLERLLDHVLATEDDLRDTDAQRLRLLALGVNAALGLEPAFVDLIVAEEGEAIRVRFEPSMLRSDDAERPRLERMSLPPDLPPGTTRVHVQKSFGWDVLRRLVLRHVPREIVALGAATAHLDRPMHLLGAPWPRAAEPRTLMRVPFTLERALARELSVRRADVEIRSGGGPSMELLERGVVLARYAFAPERFSAVPLGDVQLPSRAILDAAVLPTNASRSAVREDSPLLGELARAASAAFHRAVAALVAVVLGEGELDDEVVVERAPPEAFEDALGTLACLAVGAWRRGETLSPEMQALVTAPLLRDACGHPRAYSDLAGVRGAIRLYRGDAPLPQDLAPWMREVLWIRGRAVERGLEGLETAELGELLERARAAAERRAVFLAHEPGDVVVPPTQGELVREDFRVESGPFAGLAGQVVLRRDLHLGPRVRVFYERRELAVLHLPAATVPLPIDVALGWDGRLRPRFGFDGVEEDDALRSAVFYAIHLGIRQLAELTAEGELPDDLRPLVRAAPAAAEGAREALRIDESLRASLPASLRAAAAWPTAEAGRFASVDELAGELAQRGALPIVEASVRGRTVDGRRVVACARHEIGWLACALGVDREALVRYERGLFEEQAIAGRAAAREEALRAALAAELVEQGIAFGQVPVLRFVRLGTVGLAAVARTPRIVWLHAGRQLSREPLSPTYGPVVIVADDDAILPTAGWDGVVWRGQTWGPARVERELVTAIAAAIEGAPGGVAVDPREPAVVSYLVLAAARLDERFESDAGAADEAALEAAIAALPILTMLDERGEPIASCLARLLELFPPPLAIPVLDEPPGFETLDWHPVIAHGEVRAALELWSERRLAPVSQAELGARARDAEREQARRRLLRGPALDVRALEADPAFSVHVRESDATGMTVAVGLRLAWRGDPTTVEVCYRSRRVCGHAFPDLDLPIVARADSDRDEHFVGWRTLSSAGAAAVGDALLHATGELAAAIVEQRRQLDDARVMALCARVLRTPYLDHAPLRAALSRRALFPTAQGEWSTCDRLRRPGALVYASRVRFAGWKRGRSELDRPVLHLVDDSMLELFQRMNLRIRDVTAALERLQARRGGAGAGDAPRLSGSPAHPDMRRLLEDLVPADDFSGEVELHEGPISEITLIDAAGSAHAVRGASGTLPVRAVVRTDAILSPALEARAAGLVAVAATDLLRALQDRFDTLPVFLRDQYRALLCEEASKRTPPSAAARNARVLPGIDGGWRSLTDLAAEAAERGAVGYTSAPPPYPREGIGRIVLRLTAAEASALREVLTLRDVSDLLARALAADERRMAPPATDIRLEHPLRAACLWMCRIDDAALEGELGILEPAAAPRRGIALSTGRRLLCRLDDGPGWPLAGAVDADLEPNHFFDGPADPAAAEALVERLRDKARALLLASIAAPVGALADAWIEASIERPESMPVVVVGRVWLPRRWPRRPELMLRAPQATSAAPLRQLAKTPLLDHALPVEGQLLVLCHHGHDMQRPVLELVLAALADMIERVPEPARAPYLWNLWLLGLEMGSAPRAPTADGGEVDARAVAAELSTRGELWFSDRRGHADGDFPGEAPAFVLASSADTAPLREVLEARGARPLVRELGAVVPVEAPPPIAEPHDEPSPEPWFRDLVRRVAETVGAVEPPAASDDFGRAVSEALSRLGFAPLVASVSYAGSGRPVRYAKRDRRLVIHRGHDAVEKLAAGGEGIALLLAAAVGELNRAHESVTDAEEREALLRLLRGED